MVKKNLKAKKTLKASGKTVVKKISSRKIKAA